MAARDPTLFRFASQRRRHGRRRCAARPGRAKIASHWNDFSLIRAVLH